MFEKLKRLFTAAPRPVRTRRQDPTLGLLTWDPDGGTWESWNDHDGLGFSFSLGGSEEPSESLVRHAVEIVNNKVEFIESIHRLLAESARAVDPSGKEERWNAYREEVTGLRISVVSLRDSLRPRVGMIFFEGGQDYRLWRCDYIDGVPRNLGCDT